MVMEQAVGRDFWKGVAIDISEAEDADDVFRLAPELDFKVEKVPLLADLTTTTEEDGLIYEQAESIEVPRFVATVRTDTKEVLGVVSEGWVDYQNSQLTDFAEALRGEADVKYKRALVLFGGRIVAIEMQLGESVLIPGDPSPHANMLWGFTGHDGRHALTALRSKLRLFCTNQFSGMVRGADASFKVRHTKNMNVSIEEVRRALYMAEQYDRSFVEAMGDLTAKPMDYEAAKQFLVDLLPVPKDVENPIRTVTQRDNILDLFVNSATLNGVGMNRYRALQAVTEYVDHGRTFRKSKYGTADDARAVSLIEGQAASMKQRAFDLLKV